MPRSSFWPGTAVLQTRGVRGLITTQQQRARDQRRPLRSFGAAMIRSIDDNFRLEGRRNGIGHQWAALSPITIAFRSPAKRANPKILQDNGILRLSTIFQNNSRTLAVGTLDPRAPKHHQGGRWGASIRTTLTRRGRGGKTYQVRIRLPARPIYLFQPDDRRRWRRIQAAYLKTGKVIGG